MSIDRWLVVSGVVAAVLGIVAAVFVRRHPRTAREVVVPRPRGGVLETTRNPSEDDQLVSLAVIGGIVLWLAAMAAIAFADVERTVLRALALAAVIVTVTVLLLLIGRGSARVRIRWLVLLFAADAAVAAAPSAFDRPMWFQGRFDDLAERVPTTGGVAQRITGALKTYGIDLVPHVIVQSLGFATVTTVAAVALGLVIRRAMGIGVARRDAFITWLLGGLLCLGAVAMTGVAVAGPLHMTATRRWTAGAPESDSRSAPVVALLADRRGRVAVVMARCGGDRILELSVDGRPVAEPLLDHPAAAAVTTVVLPVGGRGSVSLVMRSTRSFETTVIFPRRPKPGEFLPTRSGVTRAAFERPGFGCG
ncbi:MAG: hypothetical protein ABJA87_03490 [bacterium]